MPTKTRINGQNYTQLPRLVSDDVILKGLPQTPGAPDGYGDLATAVNDAVANSGNSDNSISIDMHYGALLGIGARSGELLTTAVFNLSAAAEKGDIGLTITNASSGLIANQLIAIKTDAGYSSHILRGVSGGDLTISPPLPAPITTLSGAVGSFYKDQYHPSVYGYSAIADYSVNSASKLKLLVEKFHLNKNAASSTIVTNSTNTALNMGSSAVAAKNVTTNTVATQGVFYKGRIKIAGDFIAMIQTSSDSAVSFFVSLDGNASFEQTIPAGYVGTTELAFTTKEQYQDVIIRVCAVGAAAVVNVAEVVDIYQVNIDASGLNYGKHCLIGDSWFEQDGFASRLQELLPNAEITNKGVGGRKAADILAAFSADVTEDYDFIWCVCGTNDYTAGTTQLAYSNATSRIKGLSVATGAKFVMLGSSVGSADLDPTEFDLSRQYAKLTEYNAQTRLTEYVLPFGPFTVAAGANQVLANIGYFDPLITITGFYASGAGLSVRHKSTITGGGTQILAMGDNTLNLVKTTYNIGPARLVDVYANNASGSPVTYSGYLTYLR